MSRFATATLSSLAIMTLTLGGCSKSEPEPVSKAETGPAWVLTTEPGEARSITDLKASAVEGDKVVLRGLIGGTKQPLNDDSPVLRLIDPALENLCVSEDDHCQTPWDYCCAPQEEIAANSATIQIVDADGVASTELPKAHGFAELDEVVVVGTVGPRPNEQVFTIRASGVYRVRK